MISRFVFKFVHRKGEVWQQILTGWFDRREFVKEDHGQPLFGVVFNHFMPKEKYIFAAVGSNRISVYECLDTGGFQMIQNYADPDVS